MKLLDMWIHCFVKVRLFLFENYNILHPGALNPHLHPSSWYADKLGDCDLGP